jgi:hypothetical protein
VETVKELLDREERFCRTLKDVESLAIILGRREKDFLTMPDEIKWKLDSILEEERKALARMRDSLKSSGK